MADRNKAQWAGPALLLLNVLDAGNPPGGGAKTRRAAAQCDGAGRPHPARQVYRRQELSARQMAILAKRRVRVCLEKVCPVPSGRERIARLRQGGFEAQRARQRPGAPGIQRIVDPDLPPDPGIRFGGRHVRIRRHPLSSDTGRRPPGSSEAGTRQSSETLRMEPADDGEHPPALQAAGRSSAKSHPSSACSTSSA